MGGAPSSPAPPVLGPGSPFMQVLTSDGPLKHEAESIFWSQTFAEHAAVTAGKRRLGTIEVGENGKGGIWGGVRAAVMRIEAVGRQGWASGVREAGLSLLFLRRVVGWDGPKRRGGLGVELGVSGEAEGRDLVVQAVGGLIARLGNVLGREINIGGSWEIWSPKLSLWRAQGVNNRYGRAEIDKEKAERKIEMLRKLLYCAVAVLVECLKNEKWLGSVERYDQKATLIDMCLQALTSYDFAHVTSKQNLSDSSSLLSSLTSFSSRLITTFRRDTPSADRTVDAGEPSTPAHLTPILHLLIILVSLPSYRAVLYDFLSVRSASPLDGVKKGVKKPEDGQALSMAKLYECLGVVCESRAGVYLAYFLIVNHKRFRTFVQSRTDPEVLLLPLLSFERVRSPGEPLGVEAAVAVTALLLLTEDAEFCGAISLNTAEGERCLGLEVLYVMSKVLQTAIVEGNAWIARACVALMANVSASLDSLDSLTADRLVSLIDILSKRHRKLADLQTTRSPEKFVTRQPSATNGRDPPAMHTWKEYVLEKEEMLGTEDVEECLGGTLEMILGLVRGQRGGAKNRHLHYALLQRGALLRGEYIVQISTRIQVIVGRLLAVVEFLERRIDAGEFDTGDGGNVAIGLSVESVFEVIERCSSKAPGWIWDGLPSLRYTLEVDDAFGLLYAISIVNMYMKSQDRVWGWHFGEESTEVS